MLFILQTSTAISVTRF